MFVAGSRPLRTHEGRSGIPSCSSGRTARTITVPPVTFCDMRARKVPDTAPANHSVVAFAGTAMVVKAVHPDDNIGVLPLIGALSMVVAPAESRRVGSV
jgi:hypothetical protein